MAALCYATDWKRADDAWDFTITLPVYALPAYDSILICRASKSGVNTASCQMKVDGRVLVNHKKRMLKRDVYILWFQVCGSHSYERLPAETQSSLFMNILTIFLNSFLIALLLMVLPVHALAIGEGTGAHHYQVANQRGAISQRKAIAIAQSHIHGRVLDIRQHNGVYRVKILSEKGSIHIVQVNASDGEIITGH